MWLCKARAGCSLWLSSAEKDSFEGWHDGYMRLADPVKHRRLIELDKRARKVVVEDTLEMGEEHDVELFFHCHEGCSVDAIPGGYLISRTGTSLRPAAAGGGNGGFRSAPGKPGADAGLGIARLRLAPPGADHRLARAARRAVLRSEILVGLR